MIFFLFQNWSTKLLDVSEVLNMPQGFPKSFSIFFVLLSLSFGSLSNPEGHRKVRIIIVRMSAIGAGQVLRNFLFTPHQYRYALGVLLFPSPSSWPGEFCKESRLNAFCGWPPLIAPL